MSLLKYCFMFLFADKKALPHGVFGVLFYVFFKLQNLDDLGKLLENSS